MDVTGVSSNEWRIGDMETEDAGDQRRLAETGTGNFCSIDRQISYSHPGPVISIGQTSVPVICQIIVDTGTSYPMSSCDSPVR